MKIRLAMIEDAVEMLEIYRPNIEASAISFETVVPSVSEFEDRVRDTLRKYPWIVYERDGKILGYAYASTYRSRCAYGWSLESTVYVHPEHQGMGIGRSLYCKLFDLLKHQGAVNVIGGITLPNEASVGLHESLGFKKVAQFKDVGFKLGKWWDVGFWQLQLQKPEVPCELKAPPNEHAFSN